MCQQLPSARIKHQAPHGLQAALVFTTYSAQCPVPAPPTHTAALSAPTGAFTRLLHSAKLPTVAGCLWLLCALDYQFKGLEVAAIKRRLLAKTGSGGLEVQLQVGLVAAPG
jgi:hypothetical protein